MTEPKYLNLRVTNTTSDQIKPINFTTNFSGPLLKKASDYNICVGKLYVPSYLLPLFKFSINGYPFVFSWEQNGVQDIGVSFYVDWIQNISASLSYNIFDIQTWIYMVNSLFTTMFTDLQVRALAISSPLPISATPPYFIYDEKTKLISLYADVNYLYVNSTTPIIKINFNEILLPFFQGLPISFSTVTTPHIIPPYGYDPTTMAQYLPKYCFTILNLHNNLVSNKYIMTQQSSSFENMVEYEGIVLLTDVPIQIDYSGNLSGKSILEELSFSDSNIDNYHNIISYNSIFPWRKVAIINDGPLTTITVTVYAVKPDGSLRIMYLPPNSSAFLKLLFTRKN
jgi:hypothetical protein